MDFNMKNTLTKNEDNQIFFFSVIMALIFFLIIMPFLEKCYSNEKRDIRENLENILNKGIYPIDTNKCSRSCCVNSGWPLPDELLENDIDPEELKTYVPNNFSCSDGPNNKAGCLCMTQQDLDYLGSKAGNLAKN
jgi:hypothetical protein